MTLPNFLILGAAKAGTSALTRFLQAHPQVYIPAKEPNFFSGWGSRILFNGPYSGRRKKPNKLCETLEQYQALFSDAGSAVALGEASPSYLLDEKSPGRIHELIPEAKLVVILRQPVDRAFSQFVMAIREAREPLNDFRSALADEPNRIRANWFPFLCYGKPGYYDQQIARYQALFPSTSIRIFLYEDWSEHPSDTWQELTRFLGISGSFTPDFTRRYQEGRILRPRWKPFGKAIDVLMRRAPARLETALRDKLYYYPRLAPELRHELTQSLFRDEIERLQERIGRDLRHWL